MIRSIWQDTVILSADTILDHKAVDAMLVFTFTFIRPI